LDILNTDKPQSFPQTEWEKLEEKANQHYVDLKKRDYYTQESILKALKETKPQRISQETWLNLIEHLQKLYFLDITKEMQFRSVLNPLDFANKLDLSVLGDTYRERLDQEISKLSRTKAVEAENNKMTQLFDLLLSQKALGEEKPAEIEDFRWTHLKCLETQLNRLYQVDELAEKNQREAQAIADEKPQVLARREKIERQLSFINELLDDPTRANRVEEYDDTFAPGNLANLKKVAHLLVKADTHND
jgi:hypothetical protein